MAAPGRTGYADGSGSGEAFGFGGDTRKPAPQEGQLSF